jgi:hypothetical protein
LSANGVVWPGIPAINASVFFPEGILLCLQSAPHNCKYFLTALEPVLGLAIYIKLKFLENSINNKKFKIENK